MQKYGRDWISAALLISALISLPACTSVGLPPPGSGAQRTTLDEQAALGVERAYQAAALTLRTGLRSGLIRGALARKAAAADAKAYQAVRAVRAAYSSGNARSYAAALAEAEPLLSAFQSVIK